MLTKEELRQKRKDAYRAAKEKRDADPKFIAFKEKIKAQKKAYQKSVKDRNKKTKEEARKKARQERDAALMALLRPASELEKKPVDS